MKREGLLLEVPVATMKTAVSQEFLLTFLFFLDYL